MSENSRGGNSVSLRSPFQNQVKRSAPTELEKARAEAERAREDAAAAQERADKWKADMARSTRDAKFRLRTTAVIMMSAALLKLGWEAAHAPNPVPSPSIAQPLARSSSITPAAPTAKEARNASNAADESEGARALERLRDAFHAFPDEDQVALISEINKNDAKGTMTCPLAWNDGRPSLYVGDKARDVPPYMAAALNNCAAAVEKLRIERDAVAAR